MQKLTLIGNLGNDAVVNEVNGVKVIGFSVAVNERYTDKDGVVNEKTVWINCNLWRDGKSCAIAQYLTSGTKVYVEGKPDIRLYTDKNNKPAAALNCIVNNIELLSSAKKDE